MSIKKSVLVFTFIGLALAGCGPSPAATGGGPKVLASTTFLADMAQNVAGERLEVESLLPAGADPHAYEVAPSDVAKVAASTVLIVNGLEYEHFIESLLENAGGERMIVTASNGLKPHEMEDSDHTAGDPHLWLDPARVVTYVENIRDGLIEADPEGAGIYRANAEAYIAQLTDLDAWISGQVAQIQAGRRLLVTNHEALGYFAERYGFAVVGTVIPSLSSEAATSAQGLATVVEQIKATGAPAIFLGEVENPDLANQIAAETGVKVVSGLYLESLTDGPPAATYIDMMKYNVSLIVEALK
ncbi:MAG: zinc ABC transporter substrate-binding protein [Chloroflexota bacterium]